MVIFTELQDFESSAETIFQEALESNEVFSVEEPYNNCCGKARKPKKPKCKKKKKRIGCKKGKGKRKRKGKGKGKGKCHRSGAITTSPFFNFLRDFRKKCCGMSAIEVSKRGAKEWKKLPACKRAKYIAQAKKAKRGRKRR